MNLFFFFLSLLQQEEQFSKVSTCDSKDCSFGKFDPFGEQIVHKFSWKEVNGSNPSYEQHPHQKFEQ